MSPPSKPATTARPSTASNSNSVGVHSVGIGALREAERYCCCTTLFSDSQPRCTPQFEKSGLGDLLWFATEGLCARAASEPARVAGCPGGLPAESHLRSRPGPPLAMI